MQSMTGFGSGRATDARGEVRVTLSTVNNRGWQLSLKSELGDLALEDELKSTLRTSLVRGSVSAQIQVFSTGVTGLDQRALASTWRELATLARELGAPIPALEQVARLVPNRTSETNWSELARPALGEAIAMLHAARTREGDHLAHALRGHAASLRALHLRLTQRAGERLPLYREQLLRRLNEVLAERIEPAMIAREVALQAERIDVTEELVRLASHLDALDTLLASTGEIGRKLEFLSQELGREINTTGAKANDAELTGLVLDAKLVIDQLKEQAANVA